ncbi:MAG: hypothetical protein ACKO22_06510 [Cyanobium sp.]
MAFGAGRARGLPQSDAITIEGSLLDLGGLPCLVGRTTPQAGIEEDQGRSTLILCHAGTPSFRDGQTRLTLAPG